jgi:hypothetical protein
MATALNLLGQQQIGSSKPRTLQLPQNPPSVFFFTHQALKLIPVVAEFRTLTCSKASPEIRSQQACVLRVYVCVLYYSSVAEGSSKTGARRERERNKKLILFSVPIWTE